LICASPARLSKPSFPKTHHSSGAAYWVLERAASTFVYCRRQTAAGLDGYEMGGRNGRLDISYEYAETRETLRPLVSMWLDFLFFV